MGAGVRVFLLATVYVGLATVGAATWWFLYDAEGPQVSFHQLVSQEGSRLTAGAGGWECEFTCWDLAFTFPLC